MTRYGFRQALGGFFLAHASKLQALLPSGLHPLDVRPAHGVLAVTAFDFVQSEVGAYGELVLSVLVPPFAHRGNPLPHAAWFPVALATTTPASRAHASERWLLPDHEKCLEIEFLREGSRRSVVVRDSSEPVLTLDVERRRPAPATRLYQAFSAKQDRLHRVNLHISGELDEHQDETGRLELHPHAFTTRIGDILIDDAPIAEQSMESGEQRFADLELHKLEHT
jgi:hypothetical protein